VKRLKSLVWAASRNLGQIAQNCPEPEPQTQTFVEIEKTPGVEKSTMEECEVGVCWMRREKRKKSARKRGARGGALQVQRTWPGSTYGTRTETKDGLIRIGAGSGNWKTSRGGTVKGEETPRWGIHYRKISGGRSAEGTESTKREGGIRGGKGILQRRAWRWRPEISLHRKKKS